MRQGTIDTNSTPEQVKETLIGRYVSETKDGWRIVRCPWFTVMERVCQKGTAVLPFAPPVQCEFLWVSSSKSGHSPVKPGQRELVLSETAFVRLTYFGE